MMVLARIIQNVAEIAVYLGFAGGMAELVSRARASGDKTFSWLAAGYGGFILIPASLILPWWNGWRYALWGIALLWIILRNVFSSHVPEILVRPQSLYRYCGAVMLLVALWSVDEGEIQVLLFTGLPALLACALIFYRTWATPGKTPL